MKPLIQSRQTILPLLIPLVLVCFALLPKAHAGTDNTATGDSALSHVTSGSFNTADGYAALVSDTTGDSNTAIGEQALDRNTVGFNNTASGAATLFYNTSGEYNTATGFEALFGTARTNGPASFNTADGALALSSITTGIRNTATGYDALFRNTTGEQNTADGAGALFGNTTGSANTAIGESALSGNSGSFNTASGFRALFSNATGALNTATGFRALIKNTTGHQNTASGGEALFTNTTGSANTADGGGALGGNTTGSGNTALGFGAGSSLTIGNANIDIGNVGVAAESNTIRIGTRGVQTAAYMAGIFGVGVPNGLGVVVDTNGHLGTAPSSARFKDEIKPMDKASEAVLALRPVTFHYKNDTKGIPQFGLVAEDVVKVNPALVVRDAKGEIYTVRYDAVNAMLLNEFLKEHRTVEELKKQVAELTAGLQKVSAQLELNKPAPQTVLNNR